jgi:putative NADH-flavin reductase
MGNSKRKRETSSDTIESAGMADEESQKEVIKGNDLVIESLTKENEKLDNVHALEKK